MSLDHIGGETVHYPRRRDVFEFDDEVAKVFDSMAPRSIPLYNEVHRLHVNMFEHLFRKGAVVADIGSSTGHLFRNVERYQKGLLPMLGITGYAVDVSEPMMQQLSHSFPYVHGLVGDITTMHDLPQPADIMFCLYTLQFIPPEHKVKALEWLVRNTKVGGVLVLGQKDMVDNACLREITDEEYYRFRRDNGYTQAEIDAKTAALKNSMWPIPYRQLTAMLDMLPVDYIETSRWLQFSTIACIRRK